MGNWSRVWRVLAWDLGDHLINLGGFGGASLARIWHEKAFLVTSRETNTAHCLILGWVSRTQWFFRCGQTLSAGPVLEGAWGGNPVLQAKDRQPGVASYHCSYWCEDTIRTVVFFLAFSLEIHMCKQLVWCFWFKMNWFTGLYWVSRLGIQDEFKPFLPVSEGHPSGVVEFQMTDSKLGASRSWCAVK